MDRLPPAIRPWVTLSYGQQTPDGFLYGKGTDDIKFVAFCAFTWTLLRHVIMVRIFAPLAHQIIPEEKLPKHGSAAEQRLAARQAGRRTVHNAVRFAEQAWGMLYCSVFFGLGLTILSRTPAPFSPEQVWGTYPVTMIPGLTKFYYLAQLGWWFHQVYTINTEKPRKDYYQMFGHHILSISLITASYIANYTRVGVIVHALMDCCDIFLPLAKLLRYMQFRQACDAAFVVFLITWVITRQIGLFLVIHSTWVHAPKYLQIKWSPAEGYYYSNTILYTFVGMLSLLLVLCTVWFYMAVMVAVRVVRGQGAEDVRSDSEEEDEVSVDGNGSERGNEPWSAASSGRSTPNGTGHTTARSLNGNGVRRRQ